MGDAGDGSGSSASLSSLLADLGYGCCATENVMRHVLSSAGISPANAGSALSDAEIARVLGKMAQTHSGQDDTSALVALAAASSWNDVDVSGKPPPSWNVECFVAVAKEMVSFF